jgi:helicase
MVPIPVLEYKQMAGRAGRPGLDPYGESVLISKSDEEMEVLIEQYVNNDAEDIYSKLGTEGALRTHILSTVSTRLVKSREELMDFLGRTFFGHQQDTWTLAAVVDEVIEFLVTNNLIIDLDGLHPTELGELVTRLYLDPMSASTIIDGQGHLGRVNVTELTLLQLICNTPNMRPLYLRNNDYGWLDDFIQQHNDEFVAPPPPHSSEYEWFMSEVKTAVLLLEWISESKEDDITSRFNIGPGDIRAQADTAQWLMHSTARIFSYLGSEHAGFAQELVERISYGAAKELLPIIKIKGIGRVRSRKLYTAGYKDIEAIRKAEFKALADIIGPKIAANTLRQLGVDIDEKSSDFAGNIKAQQNLKDF